MSYITTTMDNLIHQTAFFNMTWGNVVMILVACVFLYLAIAKEFEPLLLVPIAFGMLLVNIYPDIMLSFEDSSNGVGGLLYYFYKLDEWAILPSLIFMGVGAMTDFGPVSSLHTSVRLRWASMTKLQLQSPSSAVQTALPLFSFAVSWDRPSCLDRSQ